MTTEHHVTLICGDGDRQYVDLVYTEVRALGIDALHPPHEDFEGALWGRSVPEYVDWALRARTRFAIVFASGHLLADSDAVHQYRLALARMIEVKDVFLLPVRLDDSRLPGLPAVGVVDGRAKRPAELARMLEEKVSERVRSNPDVEVRVERASGRPSSVVVRNLGPADITGCVYVARSTDSRRLRAWYLAGPDDLAAGAEVEHTIAAAHGFERAPYVRLSTVVDETLRRREVSLLVYVSAFESADAMSRAQHDVPRRFGNRFPPAALFAGARAPGPYANVEAVVFGTRDGRWHRLLPHLSASLYTLESTANQPHWARWHEQVRRHPLRPRAAVTSLDLPPITMGHRTL